MLKLRAKIFRCLHGYRFTKGFLPRHDLEGSRVPLPCKTVELGNLNQSLEGWSLELVTVGIGTFLGLVGLKLKTRKDDVRKHLEIRRTNNFLEASSRREQGTFCTNFLLQIARYIMQNGYGNSQNHSYYARTFRVKIFYIKYLRLKLLTI